LIVRSPKASALQDLRYEELFHEHVCVAVAPQHPFARRRAIPITEVAAEPLIGLTHEDYPDYYDYLSIIFSKVKQKPRWWRNTKVRPALWRPSNREPALPK
jgi:DNA-binding transcriptional LysR family regulator